MSSIKKVSKNIVSLVVIQISNYVLPLITIPYFTRIVEPDKFGSINFVAAFIGYFILLINFGFDITATRDIITAKNNEYKLRQVASEVYFAKAVFFLISIFIFSILVILVPQLRAELLLCIFSFLICFGNFLIPSYIFHAYQDNSKLAFYQIISKVIFTISIFIFIKSKDDYVLYPLILGISQILVGLAAFLHFHYVYKIRLILISYKRIFHRINSSKSFFFSLLIISFYTSANIIIIGLFDNDIVVGYFSAAIKIMILLQLALSVPFCDALFPYFSEKFNTNRIEGLNHIKAIFPFVLLVCFIICLLCFGLAPYIIYTLFGENFEDSIILLRILSVIPFIVIYSQFIGIHILVNLKLEAIFKKALIYGAMLGLPFNIAGAYFAGAIGISCTYLITEIFIAFLFTSYLAKQGISIKNLFVNANRDGILNIIYQTKHLIKGTQK